MTNTSANFDCSGACSPKGSDDPACGCATRKSQHRTQAARLGVGFIALCALCCAVPPALIGLGLITIATGAYLSGGLTAALVLLAVLGLGYLLLRIMKRKR